MARQLDGKVVMITGAGAGMGRAHAVLAAERGAAVIVQDIDGNAAEETAAQVAAAGGEASLAVGDIARLADIDRMVGEAEARWGRIDALVNNAGIASHSGTEAVDEAGFDRIFGVNVKGTFFMTRAVVPGMKARRSGKIVNVASRFGQVGAPVSIDYCGSKAAILGLTKSWARELAPWRICVNCLSPGGVWTEMGLREHGGPEGIRKVEQSVPLKRWAQPVEMSYTVAFLMSGEADFISGQVVPVNGGASIVGI